MKISSFSLFSMYRMTWLLSVSIGTSSWCLYYKNISLTSPGVTKTSLTSSSITIQVRFSGCSIFIRNCLLSLNNRHVSPSRNGIYIALPLELPSRSLHLRQQLRSCWRRGCFHATRKQRSVSQRQTACLQSRVWGFRTGDQFIQSFVSSF